MNTKEITFRIFSKLPRGIEFLQMLNDGSKREILDMVLGATLAPETKRGAAFAELIYHNIRKEEPPLTLEQVIAIPITPEEFPDVEAFFLPLFQEKMKQLIEKIA